MWSAGPVMTVDRFVLWEPGSTQLVELAERDSLVLVREPDRRMIDNPSSKVARQDGARSVGQNY
jgi:hypothetical protein